MGIINTVLGWLTGIKGISGSYYEAVRIDGANRKYGMLVQNHPERSAGTVFSLGGDFFDETGENSTIASQPVIGTYQMVQDMIEKDKVSVCCNRDNSYTDKGTVEMFQRTSKHQSNGLIE